MKRTEATRVPQLLRDAPEFGSMPPHVLRVAAWCYRYSEEAPTRDDVARAVTALAGSLELDGSVTPTERSKIC